MAALSSTKVEHPRASDADSNTGDTSPHQIFQPLQRESSMLSDEQGTGNILLRRESSLCGRVIDDRYRMGRTLETTCGTKIKVCEDIQTSELVVLKCVKFQGKSHAPYDRLRKEVEFLRTYASQHANIIGFRNFLSDVTYTRGCSNVNEATASASDTDQVTMTALVMELAAKHDLLSFIRECGPLPEDAVRSYFFQLTDVLYFLHVRHDICHLDIRPENLLIDASYQLKVSGFGRSATGEPVTVPEGSPAIMAPEVFIANDTKSYDGKKADIWSASVCLFVMSFGHFPFSMTCPADCSFRLLVTDMDAFWSAQEKNHDFRFSVEAFKLLRRTLSPDPEERPSISQVSQDLWLKDGTIRDMASYMNAWLSAKSQ